MPRDLADDSRLSRILEFADWSGYSEEGMLINLFGVEGETYEMVDGKPKYLDKFYVGDLPDLQQMKKDFGIDTNGWNQLYPLHFLTISLSDVQKEYYDQLKANDMYAEPNPIVVFTPSQKEDAKLIETPLQDYRNEMILKFVMGDASLEDDWDGYVERCEEKGVDELTVLYNEAWSSQN
jgi:putative aldouronate transport system substrate-binding protein